MASFAITLAGHLLDRASRLAHAVMLRGLPHGEGVVIDVAVGTFLGDTGAYLGGRTFGTPATGPDDLARQDRRGPGDRHGCATVAVVWLAGRYQEWLPGTHALVLGLGDRHGRADRGPVRVLRQA